MPLLNLNTLPPGGFLYEQPETGAKFAGMVSFRSQVQFVLNHRRGNNLARSTESEIAEDLDAYTCNRLGNDPQFCADFKKKTTLLSSLQSSVAHVAESVSKSVAGASILVEWLGDGANPVPQELAQARSDVCTGRLSGKPCPHNDLGKWSFNTAVARTIQDQIEKKRSLSLRVEAEEKAGVCGVCGCWLQLLFWVPAKTLYRHTADPQIAKLPDWCWKKHELNAIRWMNSSAQ